MLSKEANLLQQIADSRKAIRQKHMQIKSSFQENEEKFSRVFQPIIKPLNDISTITSNNESFIPKKRVKLLHSTPHRFSTIPSFSKELENLGEDEEERFSTDKNNSDILEPSNASSNNNDNTIVNNDSNNNNKMNDDNTVLKHLDLVKNKSPMVDNALGVRLAFKKFLIGNKQINFVDNKIVIGSNEYQQTEGLVELLFYRVPNRDIVQKSDIENYRSIILHTNALRKNNDPNRSYKNLKSNVKYKDYLQGLYRGKGLLPQYMNASKDASNFNYKYWDNPNELVDRLKLLIAERSAGHNNHDNEIHAIIEELREAKIIY